MRMWAFLVGLGAVSAFVHADDETRSITGRVVDRAGDPVKDADVTTFWNANGITKHELREIQKSPDKEADLSSVGLMEPWGHAPIKTDEHGRFALSVRADDYKVMVLDAERQRGAVGMMDPDDPSAALEIVLGPLVRVRGNFGVEGQAERPGDTGAIISLPFQERFPVGRDRLAFCASDQSRFAFLLPPGEYLMHAYNLPSEESVARNAETVPDVIFHLSQDQSDVDLSDVMLRQCPTLLELKAESQSRGQWAALSQRYDRPVPDWQVHDAQGLPKDVQPRDFPGKWLAIYFWGPYCRPCLKTGLPSLMKFQDQHADQQDQFQIVAFCLDKNGGMQLI